MWPMTGKEIYHIITGKNIDSFPYFLSQFHGISTDSRKINPNQIFIAIKGEKYDGHVFLKNCFAMGIRLALVDMQSKHYLELSSEEKDMCIAVPNVLASLRQFAENFRKSFHFPVIGIGGSNGKTTTKEILTSILSSSDRKVTKTNKSENGYLGLAMTILQDEHKTNEPPAALVLEIGIDEIGAMEQHVNLSTPNIVLLTALGPEHLEGLKNWETAAKEEFILFSSPNAQKIWQLSDEKMYSFFLNQLKAEKKEFFSQDIFIIEKNDHEKFKQLKTSFPFLTNSKQVIWSIKKMAADSSKIKIELIHQNKSIIQSIEFKIPLPGRHNAANFSLAFGAAIVFGLTSTQIELGFKNFVAPPMRSNIKQLSADTTLYNDAYNSSPASLMAALENLNSPEWASKRKIILLGDMLDLGNESKYWHEKLFPILRQLNNTHLCLFGSAMYDCYKLLNEDEGRLFHENQNALFWLSQTEDPAQFLEMVSTALNNSVILVKGSRGMFLERFIKEVEKKFTT